MPKKSGEGDQPSTEPVFRTVPRRPASSSACASIWRTAAWLVRKSPRALASRTASQPSSVHSSSGPSPNRRPLIPATWKRTSSRPPSRSSAVVERVRRPTPGRSRRPSSDQTGPERSSAVDGLVAASARPARDDDPRPFLEEPPGRARPIPLVPPTIRQARPSADPAATRRLPRRDSSIAQSLTWKIASISTAIPPGSEPIPTALRAPLPARRRPRPSGRRSR